MPLNFVNLKTSEKLLLFMFSTFSYFFLENNVVFAYLWGWGWGGELQQTHFYAIYFSVLSLDFCSHLPAVFRYFLTKHC